MRSLSRSSWISSGSRSDGGPDPPPPRGIDGGEGAHVTAYSQSAAVASGAARIGQELIALHAQGKAHFHRFDRRIAQVADDEIQGIRAIAGLPSAPPAHPG